MCALAGALMMSPANAKQVEFDQASIAELQAAMAAGTLTAEKLTELSLARIEAFDRKGPKIHAVIALNPKALEIARGLDAERKAGKVRGPMHGIPVVLKDNFDTVDMPTTGGSVLLDGNMAPDDAFMVKKLRDGGAIILAKVNLGEFANGMQSSKGGQTLNPHDLTRTPSGSSGATGVAVAAGYAPIGLGTDTGGSIRGPLQRQRYRGTQTDARPCQPRRHHPARTVARHRRSYGPQCRRSCGFPGRDDRRGPRR